ncbi:elongin-B [Culicoides brevitarsis]|uniref:elongin-B n=1 Tax=Culicoides brevitarsis TaxID=469753 RepID=UPI00307C0D4F
MDVFLMIRRKKSTIFTDAKDTTSVLELKRMIEGILKVSPRDQRLFSKDNQQMEDEKLLQDYGITMMTARAQSPIQIGLAIRVDGEFEPLELTPYSSPPDLPDVMKNQETTNGTEQVA